MNAAKKTLYESEFDGKRVLVTGGTKGAGKAIADRFQRGGATVIITARSAPEEKTDNHFIQADVSNPEGTSKVISLRSRITVRLCRMKAVQKGYESLRFLPASLK